MITAVLGSAGRRYGVAVALAIAMLGTAGQLAMSRPAVARDGSPGWLTTVDTVSDLEHQASGAFRDAMAYLAADDWRAALRIFEGLIASYPSTTIADHARIQLAGIYSRLGGPMAAAPRLDPVGDPASPLTAPVAPPRAAVGSTAAESFRLEAGDRVFFAPGSAELGASARQALAAQAEWLKQHPGLSIDIEGHADDWGDEPVNDRLAAERAASVRHRLIAEGIPAARITLRSAGRRERVALCSSADCQAQNRRAVTRLRVHGSISRD